MKTTGSKRDLIVRVEIYRCETNSAKSIQTAWRRSLFRRHIKARGPALFNRVLCVNAVDFITREKTEDIPPSQFFSYVDEQGKCYWFRVSSFLALKSTGDATNPWTHEALSEDLIRKAELVSIVMGPVFDNHESFTNRDSLLDPTKSLELKTRSTFQLFTRLGHMVNYEWLWHLTRYELKCFLAELWEIWYVRAAISDKDRFRIFPRHYTRFGSYKRYINGRTFFGIRRYVIALINDFVTSGESHDDSNLGANYVLTALTTVSSPAARALPWLLVNNRK